MGENAFRLPRGRADLVRVLTGAGDVIRIDDVVAALDLDRTVAAQRLSRWAEQGWLRRVGRGAYVATSIETMGCDRILDDPWVLVPALFAPAYIGGRTAAEYWDLTEQVFNDIIVMTAQHVRQKRQERHGTLFSLKHIDARKVFGTRNVWRHRTRVPVSDVHRTIIDVSTRCYLNCASSRLLRSPGGTRIVGNRPCEVSECDTEERAVLA